VVLFAVAAVGGLTLAIMKFSGKGLRWPIVIGHGVFAAAGLIALIRNDESGACVVPDCCNWRLYPAFVPPEKKKAARRSDPDSWRGGRRILCFTDHCRDDVISY